MQITAFLYAASNIIINYSHRTKLNLVCSRIYCFSLSTVDIINKIAHVST